jgi:hypothetical protein
MLQRKNLSFLVLLAGLATACGGGGGGGSDPIQGTAFEVVSINVLDGATWRINRPIVIQFSDPIDFSSISLNTVNIRTTTGVQIPGVGTFRLQAPETLVWQPNCPTRDDLSDAGLLPGGVGYQLEIKGRDSSGIAVKSQSGISLRTTQRRTFVTPASSLASAAFTDTRPEGPPVPVVRDLGSLRSEATYLQIGQDPDSRVYFERDGTDIVLSVPGFELPLNLYSDPDSTVVVFVEFDQPVNPSSTNISPTRLQLEFLDSGSNWQTLSTRVSLASNCTVTGARVKLEPIGVLPVNTQLRVVVRAGFQDIVGQTSVTLLDDFAIAPIRDVDIDFLSPPDLLSDEFKEDFDFGGESPLSFEDTAAVFDTPVAEWQSGELAAAFSFDGTGGPSGDFDWVVRDGDTFFFDTVSSQIIGGPGGIPAETQVAVGGVVDVRDLIIEEGGEIRVQGPNPMRINATGTVRIEGLLNLSGFNAKDVATLNTGNQREIGGAGSGGGGKGGSANDNIAGSTPRGGAGFGPFGLGLLGGQGGSTGYTGQNNKNNRRPGGGGGGRFARNLTGQEFPPDVTAFVLEATPGNDGHPQSRDATLGTMPAKGGAPGQGPFLDNNDGNDFFGVKPVIQGGSLTGLIRGELPSLWAGYGGGGGGNASPFAIFPLPNWNANSDEKGGGGGGSAGGLHIKALGPIVFGPEGQIRANGGRGATGENTNFLDHIGGTGGGGSGGHLILESATLVDFTDGGANLTLPPVDYLIAAGPRIEQGPQGYVDPCCRTYSNGGAGSAGVIQIHVPDPVSPPSTSSVTSDIVAPPEASGTVEALDKLSSPAPFQMIPTFGARSKVRSKWISLGGAADKPDGPSLVSFLFGGVETAAGPDEGKILRSGTSVASLPPLVAGVLEGSPTVTILPDGLTLRLSSGEVAAIAAGSTSGLSNDLYLRTPQLMEDGVVRLALQGNPASATSFSIVRALLDPGAAGPGDETLDLIVSRSGPQTLQSYLDVNAPQGVVEYAILPRFFRVSTEGIDGALPNSSFVRVLFQATRDNGIGLPDPTPVVDWTADLSKFNVRAPGEIQFFRFEVEFDLDANAEGVTADTVPVALDFLRVPFVF